MKFEGAAKPDSISVDSYEADLSASRTTDIPNNMHKMLDYADRTDSNPVYIGFAPRTLAEDAEGWLLYKLTYDASDRVTEVKIAYDTWSNRIGASYG